ncbi:hypothetical protein B0H11DRAFT_67447 [Mycena galericulata]|nr:hypothetical protein B0H11DRAFT_67447 [Mycena galericulata]
MTPSARHCPADRRESRLCPHRAPLTTPSVRHRPAAPRESRLSPCRAPLTTLSARHRPAARRESRLHPRRALLTTLSVRHRPQTFESNVEAATAILNENYSDMMENLSTRSAFAAVIAVCICAEQTFSEGFAGSGTFAHAFERAFIAYISSASKSEVESTIKALALQDNEDDEDRERSRQHNEKLVHIIQKHRLRIPKETTWFASSTSILRKIRQREWDHNKSTHSP